MSARRPSRASASALAISPGALGAETSAAPARPRLAPGMAGQAGSADAMRRLAAALAELKAMAVQPFLEQAVAALRAEDHRTAATWATRALEQDERSGMGWYCLAIAQEKAGDFKTSLQCYEAALQLAPEHDEIASNLARLAYRMGMKDIAEQLLAGYLAKHPGEIEAANNLACCQRDAHRYGEAIETLRPAIEANPGNSLLWNTLGTVLTDQGDFESALPFFDEALRLDETFVKARYNRSTAKLQLGDPQAALVDCEDALGGRMADHERAMMQLARSTMLIARGRLEEGWPAYEARLSHHYPDGTHFLIDRPRLGPDDDLRGKTLLLIGEQGLGDEVLFANLLPEAIEALGPDGHLVLAVEKRLISMFERAYPQIEVGPHVTYDVDARTVRVTPFVGDMERIDLWAPIASLLPRLRPTVQAFPPRPAYLAADPVRVAHWKGVLEAEAPAGVKVGVLWKSLKLEGARLRYFSPFEAWAPVLTTPGVTFVDLQYGDTAAETEYARERFGVQLWRPPGLDLKDDLDDVAALACALDLVLGPANATSNIAAACGAPVWLISTPGAWPKLGTERYPWYPTMRVFTPPGSRRWDAVMDEIASELAALSQRQ
ncbi:MAG TPA: tetratricopeptide repeat protein [Caulobacteraceae bacterium]